MSANQVYAYIGGHLFPRGGYNNAHCIICMCVCAYLADAGRNYGAWRMELIFSSTPYCCCVGAKKRKEISTTYDAVVVVVPVVVSQKSLGHSCSAPVKVAAVAVAVVVVVVILVAVVETAAGAVAGGGQKEGRRRVVAGMAGPQQAGGGLCQPCLPCPALVCAPQGTTICCWRGGPNLRLALGAGGGWAVPGPLHFPPRPAYRGMGVGTLDYKPGRSNTQHTTNNQ